MTMDDNSGTFWLEWNRKFIARMEQYLEQIELGCRDIKDRLTLKEGEVFIEDDFDFIIAKAEVVRAQMEHLSLLANAEHNYRCRCGIF